METVVAYVKMLVKHWIEETKMYLMEPKSSLVGHNFLVLKGFRVWTLIGIYPDISFVVFPSLSKKYLKSI
jgi:hypothetical protein